jgi:hypothetical protein
LIVDSTLINVRHRSSLLEARTRSTMEQTR